MVTLDILPGTVMTTSEMPPGAAVAITIKRALFEPVEVDAAAFSDCSIEVMVRGEVWSMGTIPGQITFVSRVFIEAIIKVAVVVILVDVRKSKP